MIRYAITNFEGYGSNRAAAEEALLRRMQGWVAEGVEFVQLREKQLDGGELLALTKKLARLARGFGTRVLVNGRADVAVAAAVHGVHLTAREGELRPDQVRQVFSSVQRNGGIVSVSCHTLAEVERAAREGADLILFGPVYEKRVGNVIVQQGVGVEALRAAAKAAGSVPLLALGGVNAECVEACLRAGASGIAAIRLFASLDRNTEVTPYVRE